MSKVLVIVKRKQNIFIILILALLVSCAMFERGNMTPSGQYVPKRENYKLKDKHPNRIPSELDTVSVYKLSKMFFNNTLIYPLVNKGGGGNQSYKELSEIDLYIKFSPYGRCLFISKQKNGLGSSVPLIQSDLSPEKGTNEQAYYFFENTSQFQIEKFVYGDGYGQYIISDYILSAGGDSIIKASKRDKQIFIRTKFPMGRN